LFNSILCKAERDLGRIAEMVGKNPEVHRERSEKMAQAINRKLWDEQDGIYYDYDLVSNKLIKRETVFSYIPLYAGICDHGRRERLINSLRTHCYCVSDQNGVGVPCYDMCQVDSQGECYWRGPVWVNINWALALGLREYGQGELADWIEASLLALVREHGFYEYYEPETGHGRGAEDFSWTAALIIDIAGRLASQKEKDQLVET
jgi:neutral trehalase